MIKITRKIKKVSVESTVKLVGLNRNKKVIESNCCLEHFFRAQFIYLLWQNDAFS